MTPRTGTTANETPRGDSASTKGLSRFLLVAVALLAAGVTLVPFDRVDRVTTASNVSVPRTAPALPHRPDGSVPSASDVFSGHERREGDDAPTF